MEGKDFVLMAEDCDFFLNLEDKKVIIYGRDKEGQFRKYELQKVELVEEE